MVVGGVWGARVAHLLLLLLLLLWRGTPGGAQDGEGGDQTPLDEEYPGLSLDYPIAHQDYRDYYGEIVDYHDPHDYYAIRFTPHLDNSTVSKCHCEGNQVWDGAKCHPHGTIVAVVEPLTGERIIANTSQFGSVQVGPVACPPGLQAVLLDSDRHEHKEYPFSLLESGDLHWHGQAFPHYCLDHTFGPDGQPNSWVAWVCMALPSVPRCCPPAHALHANNTCVPQDHDTFAPPVLVEGRAVAWEGLRGHEVNLTCGPNDHTYSRVVDSEDVSLMYSPDGAVLRWSPIDFTKPQDEHNYCVAVQVGETPRYTAKFCYTDRLALHQEMCANVTCVRKCCPQYHFFIQECVPVQRLSDEWRPLFHESETLAPGAPDPTDLTYVYDFPVCSSYFQMESHRTSEDKFYLLDNGSLYVPIFSKMIPATDYCLDKFFMENGEVHTLPLICFQEDSATASTACKVVQSYVYPVLLLVSCVFLAITLLIYVSVPELHAKVHGKCLVAHVSALLLAYVSLVTVQWSTGIMPTVACKIMASVTHFSFLAAFFWLNVMCFDIWWTLKSMRPVAETGELSRFRFKMYSVYSWGCAIIIALAAIIVQALPDNIHVIRPDFGSNRCWFDNDKSLWAYFYGFVLVLVVANIIFFAQVAYILIMAQNDPILQRTRQQNRERMWLYIKLFLVMGLTWITEVVSWQEGTCEAWIVTDIVNTLQGFSIFLIFICKKNMLKRIRNNWEPYLRHMKEFFGSSRQSQSTAGAGRQENSSFSSSVNRPSQSAASQRTVQSQISLDPSSASRKLSNSSLVSTTGVQVHSTNSISMDTINEVTCQEDEQDEKPSELTGKNGGLTTEGNPVGERESTFINCKDTISQETSRNARNSIGGQSNSIHSLDNNNEISSKASKKVAVLTATDETASTRQEDHREFTPVKDFESEVPPEDLEEVMPQTKCENTPPQTDSVNVIPVKTTENGAMKSQEDSEPFTLGNGAVSVHHNRAFTTEDEDDQPVDV